MMKLWSITYYCIAVLKSGMSYFTYSHKTEKNTTITKIREHANVVLEWQKQKVLSFLSCYALPAS